MSVKRWNNWCCTTHGHSMSESPVGLYVTSSDFDAKVQECERLKTLVALCRNSVERDGKPHIVARIDACIKEPQP